MRYHLLTIVLLATLACGKESHNDCSALSAAISQKNSLEVVRMINKRIDHMVPDSYTDENLQRLVDTLSVCGIHAQIICYTCASTNPPHSEIALSANRVIDISAVSPSNNKMQCTGMHE